MKCKAGTKERGSRQRVTRSHHFSSAPVVHPLSLLSFFPDLSPDLSFFLREERQIRISS